MRKRLERLARLGLLMSWGKAPVALSKAPTKEERERLRRMGDEIKSIDIGFDGIQFVGFRKGRRSKTVQ